MDSCRTDNCECWELSPDPLEMQSECLIIHGGASPAPVVSFDLALQIPLASVSLVLGATTPSLIISSLDKDFYIPNHRSWKDPEVIHLGTSGFAGMTH